MRRARHVGSEEDNRLAVYWVIHTSGHRALNVEYENDEEFVVSLTPRGSLTLIRKLMVGLWELAWVRTPKEWRKQ